MLNTNCDVGILDLSMPDKNSINEVCYVCGDEYKRGSLLEISTVEPKDMRDRNKPYFPIFNESHPRPARSRPKDPRGCIQACTLCYDYLMKQWNQFCVRTQLVLNPLCFCIHFCYSYSLIVSIINYYISSWLKCPKRNVDINYVQHCLPVEQHLYVIHVARKLHHRI